MDDDFAVDRDSCCGLPTTSECEGVLGHFACRDYSQVSDDGFRLSTVQEGPSEMNDLEDGFSMSTAKASPKSGNSFELSSVDISAFDISHLNFSDAELVRCLPAAVGQVYARRLCAIEQCTRDVEESTVVLEAKYPRSILRLHPAKAAFMLIPVFLGGFAFANLAACDELVAGSPGLGVANLSACVERLDRAEARSFNSEALIYRDALGYQKMLKATESWTTGMLDESGLWSSAHKPGLAFCINSTHSAYRDMVAELGRELERRHNEQVALLEELWGVRNRRLLSHQA